ncbi:MAG TPA: O-antigen ligase family protein, partial [Anaerolineales bacterium]
MSALRRASQFLANLEIWPVAFLVAASMVSSRVLPVAVGAALLFWGIRWSATGRLTVRTPADGSIALLVLLLPVTLWTTALPDVTLLQVYRLLSGIALYYALANWATSPARLRWVMMGTALAGLALALGSPLSVEWPSGKIPLIPAELYKHFTLLVSDTVHPNVMAGSLVILLPIPLAWLLFEGRQAGRFQFFLSGFSVLVMIVVLFLTQSRGAWVALGVVLIALIALRWRWGWVGFPLGLLAGIGLASVFGFTRLIEIMAASATIGGLDGRAEIWSRALYMIRDFPFTGIGMGSFGKVADSLYPFFLYSPGSVPHAHNLFLQIAVDLGIPGLIAWTATLVLMIASAWKVYQVGRRAGVGWTAGLGAGLLCSQVALVVHGLFDAVTWGMVRPAPLVWVLWGLA